MVSKLCMNCFSTYHPEESGSQCPVCGWDNGKTQPQGLLKFQTELASRYVIGRARSANGEGVTYCALDTSAQKLVDVREFFPRVIARREDDGSVAPLREHSRTFQQYMENFLELSKSVSRLREVTVVETVLDILEENGTVYTVYKASESVTLRRYVEESGGRLTWNETSRLFSPAITALSLINSLGVSHLAISPESLRVTYDDNLVITGFHINGLAGCWIWTFLPAVQRLSNIAQKRFAAKEAMCTPSAPVCCFRLQEACLMRLPGGCGTSG